MGHSTLCFPHFFLLPLPFLLCILLLPSSSAYFPSAPPSLRPDSNIELLMSTRADEARMDQLRHDGSTQTGLLMSTRVDEAHWQLRDDGGSRRSYVSCRGEPGICRDPARNPGGGFTCCWNRVCKDTEMDNDHCGSCSHRCHFGLHCCGGTCVNLLWNNFNCGKCGHRCVGHENCAFGMCGYAGFSQE